MELEKIKKYFKKHTPYVIDYEKASKSAVLVPLIYNENNELEILFQKRAKHMAIQPNEVSFPGGGREKADMNFQTTAIRETCEELGLEFENIEIFGPCDIFVAPFNMIIHPFIGLIKNPEKISPNPDEVDHLFTVPLNFFRETPPKKFSTQVKITPSEDFPYDKIPRGRDYNFKIGLYDVLLYEYNDYVIWGITAKILENFIKKLNKIIPNI